MIYIRILPLPAAEMLPRGVKIRLKVKAASKREQRKSLLLLCRAGAGSSARSAVKPASKRIFQLSERK